MPNSETQILYFYYRVHKKKHYNEKHLDSSMRKVYHCVTVPANHLAHSVQCAGVVDTTAVRFHYRTKEKLTAINETKIHNINNLKAEFARQIELKRTN